MCIYIYIYIYIYIVFLYKFQLQKKNILSVLQENIVLVFNFLSLNICEVFLLICENGFKGNPT